MDFIKEVLSVGSRSDSEICMNLWLVAVQMALLES